MNPEFIQKIKHPSGDLRFIQQKAQINVKQQLHRWGYDVGDISRERILDMSFTYRFDWEEDNPRHMLILQDPGPFGSDRHKNMWEQSENLDNDINPIKSVSRDRWIAKKWLEETAKQFSDAFLQECVDTGIINEIDNIDNYIDNGRFFDDFYYTNVIKYRDDTHDSKHRIESYAEYIDKEIEYINPEYIFVSGSPAWNTIDSGKTDIDPKPIEKVPDSVSRNKITEVHGHPFEITKPINAKIIPIIHPNPRSENWRTKYPKRLQKGLNSSINSP